MNIQPPLGNLDTVARKYDNYVLRDINKTAVWKILTSNFGQTRVCAVVFVLIEVNDYITSAHSVSMLYNQHLQIRRHIFLQDIC